MNSKSEHEPIPTLNYFEQEGEESWHLVRLILLAVMIMGFASALSCLASAFQQWAFLGPGAGTPSISGYLYLSGIALRGLLSLLIAAGCFFNVRYRRGHRVVLWTSLAQIPVGLIYAGVSVFSTIFNTPRTLPPLWMATAVAQYIISAF